MELNCHRTEYHEDVMAWGGGKVLGNACFFQPAVLLVKRVYISSVRIGEIEAYPSTRKRS